MHGQYLAPFVCEVVGNKGVPARKSFVYYAVFFQIYPLLLVSLQNESILVTQHL